MRIFIKKIFRIMSRSMRDDNTEMGIRNVDVFAQKRVEWWNFFYWLFWDSHRFLCYLSYVSVLHCNVYG